MDLAGVFRWTRATRPQHAYELLPSGSQHEPGLRAQRPRFTRSRVSTRRIVASMAAVLFLGGLYVVWTHSDDYLGEVIGESVPPTYDDVPPPLYEEYRERERHLRQHNMSLPYPEGSHAKFLWFANHGSKFGWGNYMQEMLLNSYLAYAAKRAYVFDNYTWERLGPEIAEFEFPDGSVKKVPARIPLSALITGPIIGGPMRNPDVPRAVSREYFFRMCPESERVIIDTQSIQETFEEPPTLTQVVDKWVAELNAVDTRCVEIYHLSPVLFSYVIMNTDRVLDGFPALSESPILSDFGWSPLILSEFYRNFKFFASEDSSKSSSTTSEMDTTPLKGLLALHIRRGDYEKWCAMYIGNGGTFTGFNSFPVLPDKFSTPATDDASIERALRHCLPTIPQIVEKVLDVRANSNADISRVYIMTNAPRAWLGNLTAALHDAPGWPRGFAVHTSRDLWLSWEGKYVSQAVDMHVGQRAEVFIGNGFSSLTSNIVLLRMHNPDIDPKTTRFW